MSFRREVVYVVVTSLVWLVVGLMIGDMVWGGSPHVKIEYRTPANDQYTIVCPSGTAIEYNHTIACK